jgi:glycosyltransferase involved in cell wall biosynthesis
MGIEVEVIGFSYAYNNPLLYEPYQAEFTFKMIRVPNDIRWVILKSWKLAQMAEGEIIYAFKPKWTTLFPAILASGFGFKKRLILDAEDNELWDSYIGNGFREILKHHWYVENPIWNRILHPATWFVKRKTVVCESLYKRYGGKIILHGPIKTAIEDISEEEILATKREFGIPIDKKVVLFAGKATNYNGITQLIPALQLATLQDFILVLVGDSQNKYFVEAKMILKERCQLIGLVANTRIGQLVSCADVIPIVQASNKNTDMQMPGKFIEALAYGIPTVVSNVCDLGKIVSSFYSGKALVISESNSIDAAIKISASPGFKERYGVEAKKYYNENASIDSIENSLRTLIE